MGILREFTDHIVIASLALISSGLSRQNEIPNRVRLFLASSGIKYSVMTYCSCASAVGVAKTALRGSPRLARRSVSKSRNGSASTYNFVCEFTILLV